MTEKMNDKLRDLVGNINRNMPMCNKNLRIYLASPFFNEREIEAVNIAEKILRDRGFNVFSPRENQFGEIYPVGTPAWSLATFNNDKKFIDWADVVVCLYHGNYSDSGTAWEVGYAYGTQKPVIIVQLGSSSNLMIHEGSHANICLKELETYDFESMPSNVYTGVMF